MPCSSTCCPGRPPYVLFPVTAGRERHAAPLAPHTSSNERASRKRKSPKSGGTQAAKQLTGHRAAPHTAVRRAPTGHTTIHKGTMRCEHCSNHQNAAHAERAIRKHPPPRSLFKVLTYSTRAGAAPHAPGGAHHGGGNRAVTSQPRTGQSTTYGDVKSSYRGGRRVGHGGVRDRGT